MNNPYPKWRDEHVIFLDDCFDSNDAYEYLKGAGFHLERFRLRFQKPDGSREQNVKDPRVIKLCNRYGWIILTTDSSMLNLHREHIANSPNVAIVATAHNSVETIMPWVEAFAKMKSKMEKNAFKKQLRPWYAQFNRQGRFTSGPILVTWPKGLSS